MAIEINLLSSRNKKHVAFERVLLIAKISAALLIVLTISLVVITFFLGQNSNQQILAAQEDSFTNKLTPFSKNAADIAFLHDRIKKIQGIVSKQYAFDTILTTANSQIPADVAVSSISITKTQLELTISSPSLVSIQTVTDNFTKLIRSKKYFKQMTLQGIVGNEKSGIYGLSISLILL